MSQTKVQLLRPDLGDVIDFDSSTLFMDGADNRVGIRNTNPQYELDVTGTVNATNFRGNISVGTIDDWITHTGDTDTKIGFSTADTFEIHAGGGPRVVVTSTETTSNLPVAIKKTGTNAKITLSRNESVASNDAAVGVIDFANNTGNTVNSRIFAKTAGTSNVGGDLSVETRADGGSLTEKFRITGTGQLRIQTTYDGTSTTANTWPCININNLQGSYTANKILGGVTFGKSPGHTNGIRAGMIAHYTATGNSSGNVGAYLSFRTSNNASGDSSEKLRIAADGQLLHTANKASGYAARFNQAHADNPAWIEINSPTDNNVRPAYIQLQNAGTNKWGIGQVYSSTSSGAFHICSGSHSESNSKVTIDTAGRVFIGRVAQHASSSEKLSVNGMTSIQYASASSAGLYIFNTESTSDGTIQPFLFCHDGGGIRSGLGVQRNTGKTILNGQFGLSLRTGASGVGGSEKLSITTSGLVSINATTYSALDITTTENGNNGPEIQLIHNSASPAAGDCVGQLRFKSKDSAGNTDLMARIETIIDSPTSGDESAHLNFAIRGQTAFNTTFRIKRRGTASAPSYTTDDIDGIIFDTYNEGGGTGYRRHMSLIAKSGGNTDSNLSFWTEAVGGSPTEKLRITQAGTLYSYSPDDATPNIAIRSNDTNWHGYLTQTVEGGSISSILSCGGKWSVDGTTYAATKDYNGSFPTSALVLHNQYNGNVGGHLVFLSKANGSSTTDGAVSERLRIRQDGQSFFNHPMNITAGSDQGDGDATLKVTATTDNDWGIWVQKNTGSATEYGINTDISKNATLAYQIRGNGSSVYTIDGAGAVTHNMWADAPANFVSGGLTKWTQAVAEYHYTWGQSGNEDYYIDLTCGSYFHAEFVYTSDQSNSGNHMQQYARGKWANNHTTHTGFLYEFSGKGGSDSSDSSLTTTITVSDQAGNGSVDLKSGLSSAGAGGATYRGMYGGGNENSGGNNNGRLRFAEDKTNASGSVANRSLIVKVYYGSFSISKSVQ